MTTTDRHAMSLDEFARLARLHVPLPNPEGNPVIISAALASALNALIEAAHDVAVAGPLADALAEVRALHDYTTVRLGGERR